MNTRLLTPWTPRPELFSDFYRRDAAYTNWRPHGSGDCLLIYTQSGAGKFVTPSGNCIARKGDAVLYTPLDRQDYSTCQATGKWNLFWVHFTAKPHWQIWLNWPSNRQGLKLLRTEGESGSFFARAMRGVVRLSRLPIPEAQDLAANALEEALIWAHALVSGEKWRALDHRVRRAIEFLSSEFRNPIDMETLAQHCRTSPSRLAHLFKANTRETPQHFLENHRMQQACTLLRITQSPIVQIAAEVGYSDPFYFTNRFRRHQGMSPRQFRDKIRKTQSSLEYGGFNSKKRKTLTQGVE